MYLSAFERTYFTHVWTDKINCVMLSFVSNYMEISNKRLAIFFPLPFSTSVLYCWFCNFFSLSSPLCPHLPLLLLVLQASLMLLQIVTFLCVCVQFWFSSPCHSPKIFFIPQMSKFPNQASRPSLSLIGSWLLENFKWSGYRLLTAVSLLLLRAMYIQHPSQFVNT